MTKKRIRFTDIYMFITVAQNSKASECLLDELHVDGHELGHEGLQVVDGLVALVEPVLVVGRYLAQLRLQLPVTSLGQLLLQTHENHLKCQSLLKLRMQCDTEYSPQAGCSGR